MSISSITKEQLRLSIAQNINLTMCGWLNPARASIYCLKNLLSPPLNSFFANLNPNHIISWTTPNPPLPINSPPYIMNYMDYITNERRVDDKLIAHPGAQRLPKIVSMFHSWRHDIIHHFYILFMIELISHELHELHNQREEWMTTWVG